MFKNKVDFNKIKEFFTYIIYFLGKKSFLVFIMLTFVTFFAAAAVFYFYVYIPLNKEPEVEIKEMDIDNNLYETFVEDFTKRTLVFKEANSKVFEDLFFQEQLD